MSKKEDPPDQVATSSGPVAGTSKETNEDEIPAKKFKQLQQLFAVREKIDAKLKQLQDREMDFDNIEQEEVYMKEEEKCTARLAEIDAKLMKYKPFRAMYESTPKIIIAGSGFQGLDDRLSKAVYAALDQDRLIGNLLPDQIAALITAQHQQDQEHAEVVKKVPALGTPEAEQLIIDVSVLIHQKLKEYRAEFSGYFKMLNDTVLPDEPSFCSQIPVAESGQTTAERSAKIVEMIRRNQDQLENVPDEGDDTDPKKAQAGDEDEDAELIEDEEQGSNAAAEASKHDVLAKEIQDAEYDARVNKGLDEIMGCCGVIGTASEEAETVADEEEDESCEEKEDGELEDGEIEEEEDNDLTEDTVMQQEDGKAQAQDQEMKVDEEAGQAQSEEGDGLDKVDAATINLSSGCSVERMHDEETEATSVLDDPEAVAAATDKSPMECASPDDITNLQSTPTGSRTNNDMTATASRREKRRLARGDSDGPSKKVMIHPNSKGKPGMVADDDDEIEVLCVKVSDKDPEMDPATLAINIEKEDFVQEWLSKEDFTNFDDPELESNAIDSCDDESELRVSDSANSRLQQLKKDIVESARSHESAGTRSSAQGTDKDNNVDNEVIELSSDDDLPDA